MTHPIVAEIVGRLDENDREEWEERAAILQFDAAASRELAEALALVLVLKKQLDRAPKAER